MPGSPQLTISSLIPAAHWYIHFNDATIDAEHNDHMVVCFGLSAVDSITIIPFVTDPVNQQNIVEASYISADYSLYNQYSECVACVRPGDSGRRAQG